ncbi:hypothetical protein HBO37_21015 [Pseudomonas proteolytica]|uniref:hypothetical protein n=1 Tax=Pseudomonas proteolytica TaxID=219574 RepID=UPI001475CA96|nr:hypothetical protein [Pseudomonas proteolytica]NMZ07835.1 hypothetical protein [Pseudomonas proteolytica]
MDNVTNPAAELLKTMETLRGANGDSSTLDVLAHAFDLKNSDVLGLGARLVELGQLNTRAKKSIELHVFGIKDMYLTPFNQISLLLADLKLTSTWKHNSHKINDMMIMGLKFADHFLSNSIATDSAPKSSKAVDLASKIDALLDDCLESDLEDDLKQFFADILNKIRSALTQYRIYGPSALEQVLNETVGAINRRGIEITSQSDVSKGFIGSVFDTIGKVNDLVSASDTVKAIATSGAIFFLPHLS